MTAKLQAGPYALTDHDEQDTATLVAEVRAALEGGVRLVQYRDKRSASERREEQARALLDCCRAFAVPLVINDDVALAAKIHADGVHLGRDDPDPAGARKRLGSRALIGVSCYNEMERARAAARAGADYLAFGSVFPSATKPEAVHAPLELLTRASAELDLPVCAIGGITPENAPQVVAAGADLLAVIRALWDGSPRDNARALQAAFAGAADGP